jgi:hypothetical protein
MLLWYIKRYILSTRALNLVQLKQVNLKGFQMNGYKAFYKGKTIEVLADSSYQAQLKAAQVFKAKKAYEVTVMLCEVNGDQVIHAALF